MTVEEAPAVEVASVAYQIAASYETSEPIVVRTNEFSDAQAAVEAALAAHNAGLPAAVRYRILRIDADYDVHGSHARLEGVEFGEADGLVTVVATIHAAYAIDKTTEISVLSSINREIQDACDESSDFAPYISQILFVIDEA